MKALKYFEAEKNKAETAILAELKTSQQGEVKTKESLNELEFLADTTGAVTVNRFSPPKRAGRTILHM